jgi:hypothetical protein
MGLIFVAPFRAVTLGANSGAQQDIFELKNSTTKVLKIHEWMVSSQYNVDERVDLQVFTRTAVGSGGGSAITPQPELASLQGVVSSGITSFKTMIAGTVGTGGIGYDAYQWSQLERLLVTYTPELRPEISSGFSFCLNNNNTFVASNRIISGYVKWEEN